MTDTLFPLPEQKSPRLLWIEKHGVIMEESSERWHAYRMFDGGHYGGTGKTQDDALADWARKNNVRLWNEEI
jgi:hypothetical protein